MKTPFLFATLCLFPLAAQGTKEQKAPAAAPAPPPPPSDSNDVTVVKQVPYQPAVNREPFQALGDSAVKDAGDYVDDIAVKGCFKKEGKVFAIVSDSRGTVRWLEVGYRFKDGMIAAIDDKSVTFHQWDPNSTNTNVFKKVVKTFKREEVKR